MLTKGRVKRISNRSFYLIEEKLGNLDEKINSELRIANGHLLEKLNKPFALGSFKLPKFNLKDMLFIDVECCGFAHKSPAILIGALNYNKGWKINEMFARDYSEEKAVLEYFSSYVKNFKFLFSYNGISFDVPRLKARALTNSVSLEFPKAHFDVFPLIKNSSKSYEKRLPDYKLSTVEKHLLGKERENGIDGSMIEKAYTDYVMTGNDKQVNEVIKRNMIDLVSTLQVLYFYANKA
jgi:hypothetical protein